MKEVLSGTYENACKLDFFFQCGHAQRHIFYDVNPGEGFNLRRDVYMRVAVFVRNLNRAAGSDRFALVLPPWGRLYHWQSRELGRQTRIQWEEFFDVDSLRKYIPVMDLDEYLGEWC